MSRIAVNGAQYYVEQAGEGPALLLLHGFTGAAATWAPHVAAWASQFHTIAVDLLGHGASDAPPDPARYSMEHTVGDLAALLDALNVPRAFTLGYSMGGRVALHFAAAYPARVAGLVLESASPGLPSATERAARVAADEELAAFIEREGVPAFVARWEALPLWASQARLPEATRAAQRAGRLRNRAPGLAGSLRGLGTGAQAPLHSRLHEITAPTLLIAGALDPKFAAIAGDMAARLPDARAAIVPDAGHAVHLERPTEFDGLVAGFLSRLRAASAHPGQRRDTALCQ
jgi:2-succinyl-6-hydroxy-2,4-cyclohexadiene-1-carboxylate synthase